MTISDPNAGPVRLIVQQPPAADAENGSVVLTLIVFEVGQPQHAREIQAVMSLENAKHTASQLRRANDEAQRQQRLRS
jgi:hypothetical protein